MKNKSRMTACLVMVLLLPLSVWGQVGTGDNTVDQVDRPVGEIVDATREQAEALAEKVDESQTAQETSAGILTPIYALAEAFSFSGFHWVAFTVMVTGVVSYALQLVVAKLVVLSKRSLSLAEILSDALGLVISLVGLVLTTQAATENSNFTRSPALVLSAALVGVIAGCVFYWWGQSQEVQAVAGRRIEKT